MCPLQPVGAALHYGRDYVQEAGPYVVARVSAVTIDAAKAGRLNLESPQ